MSLLPQQIPPQTVPFGKANPDGSVTISESYWLFLYNLWLNSGISTTGLSPAQVLTLSQTDDDITDSDAIVLRRPLSNLAVGSSDYPQVSDNDLPSIARALLLAQDGLLPDTPALAQPVTVLTPGASPWTYKAPSAGNVVLVGGTVSAIAISRQGASVATGLTAGIFPLCRGDSLVVTYSGAPTVTFMSWSSQ